MEILHPPDSDDDDDSELTSHDLVEAIIESTCMRTVDHAGAQAIAILLANPVFDVLRTAAGNALVLFFDGRHQVFTKDDLDEYFR